MAKKSNGLIIFIIIVVAFLYFSGALKRSEQANPDIDTTGSLYGYSNRYYYPATSFATNTNTCPSIANVLVRYLYTSSTLPTVSLTGPNPATPDMLLYVPSQGSLIGYKAFSRSNTGDTCSNWAAKNNKVLLTTLGVNSIYYSDTTYYICAPISPSGSYVMQMTTTASSINNSLQSIGLVTSSGTGYRVVRVSACPTGYTFKLSTTCYVSGQGSQTFQNKCALGDGLTCTDPTSTTDYVESTTSTTVPDSGVFICNPSLKQIYNESCEAGRFYRTNVINCDLGCSASTLNIKSLGLSNVVKCNGNYTPNQNFCSSDGKTFYKTDSSGNLNITPCGLSCNSLGCTDCNKDAQQCADSFHLETCDGLGHWPGATVNNHCQGILTCDSSKNACTSNIVDGTAFCGGTNSNQPQKWNATQGIYVNTNSGPCDAQTRCQIVNNVADCLDKCSQGDTWCSGGTLWRCSVSDKGNVYLPLNGNSINDVGTSDCYSGNCINTTSCNTQFSWHEGQQVCAGTNNNQPSLVQHGNDPLAGYITTSPLAGKSACVANNCAVNGNVAACTINTYCQQAFAKGINNFCQDSDTSMVCDTTNGGQTVHQSAICSGTTNGVLTMVCNDTSGLCNWPPQDCAGHTAVCVDRDLYACSNGYKTTSVTHCVGPNYCGQDTNGNGICLNECSAKGVHSCQNGASGNSYVCMNVSTGQIVWNLETTCGVNGCNLSSGKCLTDGPPLSTICISEAGKTNAQTLIKTDANGFVNKSDNSRLQCDQLAAINSVPPYCAAGKTNCIVCNSGANACGLNSYGTCANEVTGAITGSYTCSAGCYNLQCDQLLASITSNSKYKVGDHVIISGIMIGSISKRYINNSKVTATLASGTSTTQAVGPDGNWSIDLGPLPLNPTGYGVTIHFNGFDSIYDKSLNLAVASDYIVKYSGSQAVIMIPGTSPSVGLTCFDSNGNPAGGLIIISSPSGISLSQPVGTGGSFTIPIISATPGTYQVNVSPTVNGTRLDIQSIEFDIQQPQLSVTSNVPTTASGSTLVSVSVVGPTSTGLTTGIDSTVTATMNGNPVTLSPLGAGQYQFTYNFAQSGSNSLSLLAQKAGYADGTKSYVTIVGGSTPKNDSNGGGAVVISNQWVNGIDNIYIILGAVAILVIAFWLIERNKK